MSQPWWMSFAFLHAGEGAWEGHGNGSGRSEPSRAATPGDIARSRFCLASLQQDSAHYFTRPRPLSNATSTTALKPIQAFRYLCSPVSSNCSKTCAAVLFVRSFVGAPVGARICSGLTGTSSGFIQESLIRTRNGANTVLGGQMSVSTGFVGVGRHCATTQSTSCMSSGTMVKGSPVSAGRRLPPNWSLFWDWLKIGRVAAKQETITVNPISDIRG
jgi:hypothetical protein